MHRVGMDVMHHFGKIPILVNVFVFEIGGKQTPCSVIDLVERLGIAAEEVSKLFGNVL